MTCRRRRYTAEAAHTKVRRITAENATVGLTTEGHVEWCAQCEAWHMETKSAWRDAS